MSDEKRKRVKLSDRVFDTRQPDKIGGEHAYRCFRQQYTAEFRNKPGFADFRRTHVRDGMTKADVAKYRDAARILAARYKDNLRMNGYLTDPNSPNLTPEEAADALRADKAIDKLLEIGCNEKTPVAEQIKALSKVGDLCKKKTPSRAVITTVDTRLDWLKTIGAQTTEVIEFQGDPDA